MTNKHIAYMMFSDINAPYVCQAESSQPILKAMQVRCTKY